MGGIVNVLFCMAACFMLLEAGLAIPGYAALILSVVAVWAWGQMLRYDPRLVALRLKKLRRQVQGMALPAEELARVEQMIRTGRTPSMPRWVMILNASIFLAAVCLVAYGAVAAIH